jgi:eukaryotic-like serine/threonine-protein kinase
MKKQYVSVVIGILLLASFTPGAMSGTNKANTKVTTTSTGSIDWPMMYHDAQRTGLTTTSAPNNDSILWSGLYYPILAPIVSGNKLILATNSFIITIADAFTGTELSEIYVFIGGITSLTADAEHIFVTGSSVIQCYSLSDNSLVWSTDINGSTSNVFSPIPMGDKLYYAYNNFEGTTSICCITTNNGSVLWNTNLSSTLLNDIVMDNGKIYAVYGHSLSCFDATTGASLWDSAPVADTFSKYTPAITNGRLYAMSTSTTNGVIYCFNLTTHAVEWQYATHDVASLSKAHVSVGSDKVFVGTSRRLFCLNQIQTSTPTPTWIYNVSSKAMSTPIVADGKVFVRVTAIGLHCVNINDGTLKWMYPATSPYSPAIANGILFYQYYLDADNYGFIAFHAPNHYAPTTPQITGPTQGVPGASYTFTIGGSTDADGDMILYDVNWSDGHSETFGPYVSGATFDAMHTWMTAGTFIIHVTAHDFFDATSNPATHTIELINNKPTKPTITGPSNGLVGQSLSFTAGGSTDLDTNQHLSYTIRWMDGTSSSYGPFNSGETFTATHIWNNPEVYPVRVSVTDSVGGTNVSDLLFVTIIIQNPTQDFWTMYGHDMTHKGLSSSVGPNTNQRFLQAVVTTNDGVTIGKITNPIVVNGNLYFSDQKDRLFCINITSGNTVWQLPITSFNDETEFDPSYADGVVYVAVNHQMQLESVNATTGAMNWIYSIPDNQPVATPITVANGKVLFGTYDGKVYCLSISTHTEDWVYSLSHKLSGAPAVAYGYVYFSDTTSVYCLDLTTGTLIWKYSGTMTFGSNPTVSEGKVIIGSSIGRLCLSAYGNDDGTTNLLWSSPYGTAGSSQAVGFDNVYTTSSNMVFCLNVQTGNLQWQKTFSEVSTFGAPALADNLVYLIDKWTHSNLYCLDASSGDLVWTYKNNSLYETDNTNPQVAIVNGCLYQVAVISGGAIVFGFNGHNLPPATPDTPSGPSSGVTGLPYTFTTGPVSDPDVPVSYQFDFDASGSHAFSSWSTTPSSSHIWIAPGSYKVKVRAKDNFNASSPWSNDLAVTITNTAPNAPQITGPGEVIVKTNYTFTIVATDPENQTLTYLVKWGDVDQIFGPFASGVSFSAVHQWLKEKNYTMTVTVFDSSGLNNSVVKSIKVGHVSLLIQNIENHAQIGIRQITADIYNNGTITAFNIQWKIILSGTGFIFKGGLVNGTISSIAKGSNVLILDKPVSGLGKVDITFRVSADNLPEITVTAKAFLFFGLVIMR